MARGGVRNGTPGKAYGQRTDLGVAKLPSVAAPGQTYGAAGAQIGAQQAMPMAAQPTPGGAEGEAAPPGVTPGSLGPLNAPTNRPDEPLTHGAVGGAGSNIIPAGPPPPPSPVLKGMALLNSLGDQLPASLKSVRDSLAASQANENAP